MRTARVLSPRPSPSPIPAAMAITFLVAPAISTRRHRCPCRCGTCCVAPAPARGSPASSSDKATTQAAGCPCATSRARFGPVRTPAGTPGRTSATTCDMRRLVPISIPLARLTTASTSPASGCMSVSTARNPCDGTAMKTMLTPWSASASDDVTVSPSGSGTFGRYFSFARGSPMDAASSGDRTQRDGTRGTDDGPDRVPSKIRHRLPPPGRSCHQSLRRTCNDVRVDPYTVRVSRASVPPADHAAAAVDLPLGPEVVLIPVKAFHQAKRSSGPPCPIPIALRSCATMATQVVAACVPLPVAVVCDDQDVAQWAADVGATVMWEPGQGLNGAVRAGVDRLARAGTRRVTVAHGDLPRAHGLGVLAPFDGITLVPDRRDDGTNVLRLPAGSRLSLRLRCRFLSLRPGGSHEAGSAGARPAGPGPGLRRRLARRRRASSAGLPDLNGGRGAGGPKAPGLACSRRNEALTPLGRLAGREPASWWPCARRRPLRCPLGRSPLLGGPAHSALGRLLGRSPLLGSLPGRRPLLGGLAHCRTLRRLFRRSPLLGGLARLSPLGRLFRRSPLLRSLPCRSPLHGLPCRSPLDGLLGRRALRCFLCGGPLFCGLFGRGPSFCGYCHRCTSLGAWSLNRGEACATSRSTASRRAHCRTGFTCNCAGCRRCVNVMNAATSRQTDLLPRVATSRRRPCSAVPCARRTKPTCFRFCAPHTVVSLHMSYPPSRLGYAHSSVVCMPRSSIH